MKSRISSFERIDKIIERMIRTWQISDGEEESILGKIEEAIGKELCKGVFAKRTTKRVTLFLKSTTLYHELSVYKKKEILESLRECGVQEIRFKLLTSGW